LCPNFERSSFCNFPILYKIKCYHLKLVNQLHTSQELLYLIKQQILWPL